MHLAIHRVGRYSLRRLIARGPSSSVYDAWDPNFERRLAIKLIPLPRSGNGGATERFRQGARAAARLSHNNIVAVHDYGEHGDFAYLAMEYIDGPTLKSLLAEARRFDLAEVRSIAGSMLDALQYSHDQGVVHRGIRPGNIMFTRDGHLKLIDFAAADPETGDIAQAAEMPGSPAYMSPEQFTGGQIDARTDVYSVGLVLYEMLTGERAYTGSTTTIMHNKQYGPLPVPSRPLAAPLTRLITRAIARDREMRFATAAEFHGALLAAVSLSQAAPAPPERQRRAGRKLAAGVAALGLLLAAVAAIWCFAGSARAPPSRAQPSGAQPSDSQPSGAQPSREEGERDSPALRLAFRPPAAPRTAARNPPAPPSLPAPDDMAAGVPRTARRW